MNEKKFTPEEIAKSLRVCGKQDTCEGCPLEFDDECPKTIALLIEDQVKRIAELEAELAKLREENRWIPVEERLPEHNKPVLVYCENFTIQGGHTVHIGSCDTACGSNFWFLRTQPGVSSFPNHEWRVTHWKPMPKRPEAGHE